MSDSRPYKLHVDIVSDVVCPWCIIGYRQLDRALSTLSEPVELSLRWHPFELNPHMPEAGQDLREHLAQKYGTTAEQSRGARQRLTELGESLGFKFDYFDGMRMVNTFRAHQLLHWSNEQGLQTALKLELFEAFFSRREDVNDVEILVASAARVGLPGDEARAILGDQRYADQVRAEQAEWLDQGVHAVPTFVFDSRYQVPGAQDAETFVRVIEKLRSREVA